jgi:hypothetical protein
VFTVLVSLALEVDRMLGARLAGAVKPAWQKQTVRWVNALEVPEWLKLELLGKTQSAAAIPGLLKALEDQASSVRWSAAVALGRFKDDSLGERRCHRVAHILPNLLTPIPTQSGEDAFRALTAIQANGTGQLNSKPKTAGCPLHRSVGLHGN